MNQSWQTHPIHVLDFEGSRSYGIIEFGVVTIQNGAINSSLTRLCQAEDNIDERDAWLHGLRREDTDGHPPFTAHWETFNQLRQSGPLGAHHASVENQLLKRIWPYPTSARDFLNPGKTLADWGPWIDTRALYQKLYPELSEHKLGNLISTFDLQSELDHYAQGHCPVNRCKYHCALYDALASAVLLLNLAAIPYVKKLTLAELISLSSGQNPERQAEFF